MTSNYPHMHNNVDTQVWFIVGAHIASLVPRSYASYIHPVHHFGAYRYGGDELTATSDSPNGDTGPVVLAGSEYDDNLSGLKDYVISALPDRSMLTCMYQSNTEWLDDGTMIALPMILDESTPAETCRKVHVDRGTPVSILSFFENSTHEGDWYAVHTTVRSSVIFDEDPFIA